mgnify:CR=1 FL=1
MRLHDIVLLISIAAVNLIQKFDKIWLSRKKRDFYFEFELQEHQSYEK